MDTLQRFTWHQLLQLGDSCQQRCSLQLQGPDVGLELVHLDLLGDQAVLAAPPLGMGVLGREGDNAEWSVGVLVGGDKAEWSVGALVGGDNAEWSVGVLVGERDKAD